MLGCYGSVRDEHGVTDRGYLYDLAARVSSDRYFIKWEVHTMKLKAQLKAVPRAAPLVRIDRELISVGYSHGTPWKPIPKHM